MSEKERPKGVREEKSERILSPEEEAVVADFEREAALLPQLLGRDFRMPVKRGQPGGGEYPGGGNFPGQPAPQNPWATGQPTMAMQQQQWQQNTMFPQQQATERRGQNYAAYGRATPRNVNWG